VDVVRVSDGIGLRELFAKGWNRKETSEISLVITEQEECETCGSSDDTGKRRASQAHVCGDFRHPEIETVESVLSRVNQM